MALEGSKYLGFDLTQIKTLQNLLAEVAVDPAVLADLETRLAAAEAAIAAL